MLAGARSCGVPMLVALVVSGAGSRAQQPGDIQSEDGVLTLHADTHLVLLDVTVLDKQKHPVTGLTKDDFKLLEDGKPQTIKLFDEHAPVDPAEIAKEKAAALAAQTKIFEEEDVPVDPAGAAGQKAAAIAGQPPNTFTNYEPFTGRPVTVLLLNELFPVWMNHQDQDPLVQRMVQDPLYLQAVEDASHHWRIKDPELAQAVRDPQIWQKILWAHSLQGLWEYRRQMMLDKVQSAPPDTPFALYSLDSKLRLVQSITTDRALLQARIDLLWKSASPHVGSEQMINPTGLPRETEVPTRRRIFADAVQQLASSLKGVQGRKNLYVFTGPFHCAVAGSPVCPDVPNGSDYLCGLMDTLEQGRMSIYRYYGGDNIAYGFGCLTSVGLGTSASYYTLYYTPTNGDWSGKYRTTKIEVTGKDLKLKYRQGYYGTSENIQAHYVKGLNTAPIASSRGVAGSGQTIAASTVASGTAARESPGTGAATAPTNPVSAVFTVQVIPADTTVVPASATSATDKEKQEYRQLKLRFAMPASEFKVVQSGSGQYAARLLISAVGYADGSMASSDGDQSVQMAVNFDGAADPRIATSTITGEMKLNVPEHGKSRWLLLTVRDQATGQMGSMLIPMEQVKMPGAQ